MGEFKGMTREEAWQIIPGDIVEVDPLYNESTSIDHRRLKKRSQVIQAERGEVSQTGVMLTVCTESGRMARLDAGWFRKAESIEDVTAERDRLRMQLEEAAREIGTLKIKEGQWAKESAKWLATPEAARIGALHREQEDGYSPV